jgi:hypothetical protein
MCYICYHSTPSTVAKRLARHFTFGRSRVLTPVPSLIRCGFFSKVSSHYHIVVCLISQIRRMLGQCPTSQYLPYPFRQCDCVSPFLQPKDFQILFVNCRTSRPPQKALRPPELTQKAPQDPTVLARVPRPGLLHSCGFDHRAKNNPGRTVPKAVLINETVRIRCTSLRNESHFVSAAPCINY